MKIFKKKNIIENIIDKLSQFIKKHNYDDVDKNFNKLYKDNSLYKVSDLDFNFLLFKKIYKFKKNKKNNFIFSIKLFWNIIKTSILKNKFYVIGFFTIVAYLAIFSIKSVSLLLIIIRNFIIFIQNNCSDELFISIFFKFLLNDITTLFFLFMIVVTAFCYRLRDYCKLKIVTNICYDVKKTFMEYLFYKNYDFFMKYGTGKVAEIIDESISGAEEIIYSVFGDLSFSFFVVVFSMFFMMKNFINGYISLFMLIFSFLWFLCFIITIHYNLIYSQNALFISNLVHLKCSSSLTDLLFNIDSIKRNVKSELEIKNMKRNYYQEFIYDYKYEYELNKLKMLGSIFLTIYRIIVIFSCFSNAYDYLHDHNIKISEASSIANIILDIFYIYNEFCSNVFDFCNDFLFSLEDFYRAMVNIAMFKNNFRKNLLLKNKKKKNKEQKKKINETEQKKIPKNINNIKVNNDKLKERELINNDKLKERELINKKLIFENVSLTIGKNNIIKNFNYTFELNKKYGLVGSSGSGKTTIFHLISGLYKPTKGSIYYNGNKMKLNSIIEWRKNINYIPQSPILFNRDILSNIIFGVDEFSIKDVLKASCDAYIYNFIKKMFYNFSFKVGNKGDRLSGGQRQRIMIARAFLRKKSNICLIDEATSALDSKSELIVLRALSNLVKNKISIYISHDLEQFCNFDQIIVLDNGVIVEAGSFEELLKNKKNFFQLWENHCLAMENEFHK